VGLGAAIAVMENLLLKLNDWKRDIQKLARDDHDARATTFAAVTILTEHCKNCNPQFTR
jgi:hypothetical protein